MTTIIDKGAYKIKIWGKQIDGEFVVDGYSYKGRRSFLKALEGFKAMMVKGFVGDINGVKVEVLDSRIVGAELAIEIACTQNNNRGIAVLKLYGPSTKKQNVVMATKSKGSDQKYVKLLAETIIEPLINEFLNDSDGEKDKDISSKEAGKNIICSVCDKTAKNAAGLKGHMTKMHGGDQLQLKDKQERFDVTVGKDESRDIVKLILDEIVDDNKKIVIDESVEDEKKLVKYENKCDKCDYKASANRRYIALQIVQKHKEEDCPNRILRKKVQCSKCDYRANNSVVMKRHMRDIHEVNSKSISPPSKKLRKTENYSEDESMEIDDENLDFRKNERDILQKLSDDMDAKVKEKERINNEKEAMLQKKKIEEEKKIKEIEANILEQSQILNKKRKQSLKNQRKKANKISKQMEIDINIDETPIENQKTREIPDNCKHLFEKNDVIYIVPGDGSCGPNSAAAFLFQDEIFGPKLRIRMNKFMAKHWIRKYKDLTQCSQGSPFVRKLGLKTVRFTDPEALLEFLKTEEAAYLWTDSEDLAVISDMYQVEIKIVTSKGKHDKNPTENWIKPDPDMRDVAELKDVDLETMVLYHENDCHFDLVIDKYSELAVKGSISTRLNDGVCVTADNKVVNDEKENKSKDSKEMEIVRLKKELKISTENFSTMEKKYIKYQEELKSKTEEAEILKAEVKDLRMIIKLKDELDEKKSNSEVITEKNNCKNCDENTATGGNIKNHARKKHIENPATCDESSQRATSAETLTRHKRTEHVQPEKVRNRITDQPDRTEIKFINCTKCRFQTTSKNGIDEHIKKLHVQENKSDEEFNCRECCFQATTDSQLKKHFVLKHTLKGLKADDEIRCKNCGESFIGKRNLMVHRKQKHKSTVAVCNNYLAGKCPFSPETCWWNHTKNSELKDDTVVCFTCDETFVSKNDMMKHRKCEHEAMVRPCSNFLKNNCQRQDNTCWFIHKDEAMDTYMENMNECKNKPEEVESNQVFQKVSKKMEPPLMKNLSKQKME